MNINAINTLGFQAKVPKLPPERVKVVGKVNGYIEQMLNDGSAKLENIANIHKTDVRIAQKGDLVLVNSGPKTTYFDYKAMSKSDDFYQNIINNIRENSNIKKLKIMF